MFYAKIPSSQVTNNLQDLDAEHVGRPGLGLVNLLSTPAAEFAHAQIVDGFQ